MTLLSILAFSGAMFLLAITPGPGVFATISRAMASGFTNASFVVLGIVLGDIIFLLLAIFGLSTIAVYLGDLFVFVKYAGGLYLLYLGFKILSSKVSKTDIKAKEELSIESNQLYDIYIKSKTTLFFNLTETKKPTQGRLSYVLCERILIKEIFHLIKETFFLVRIWSKVL